MIMLWGAAKEWALAELAAFAPLRAAIGAGTPIRSGGEELPAEAGVYVTLADDSRAAAYADQCELRIEVYISGEVAARDAMNAVATCLLAEPGAQKTWGVDPRTKRLRLKGITRGTARTPERDGVASGMYSATLVYTIRGSAF